MTRISSRIKFLSNKELPDTAPGSSFESTVFAGGIAGGVKAWVKGIEVLAVQLLLNASERFAEPLEVNDFPCPQEADGICHFRVFDQAQQIVIGFAGLLLCCQIFKQIRDGIAGGLEFGGGEGVSACGLRPHASGVICIIGSEAGALDLLWRQPFGELMDNGAHDFQMGQLLCACRSI